MDSDNDYAGLPAELRERAEAFLDEHNAVARELVRHAYFRGSARERQALVEHVDALIAERTRAFEQQLDAAAMADIEASYAAMPVSLAAYAQAGGAAEALFSLRQRLTQPVRPARDE